MEKLASTETLPPLPPPIWLLIFGFLKHDAMPTYASDASDDTGSDDDEFGDEFDDEFRDAFGGGGFGGGFIGDGVW